MVSNNLGFTTDLRYLEGFRKLGEACRTNSAPMPCQNNFMVPGTSEEKKEANDKKSNGFFNVSVQYRSIPLTMVTVQLAHSEGRKKMESSFPQKVMRESYGLLHRGTCTRGQTCSSGPMSSWIWHRFTHTRLFKWVYRFVILFYQTTMRKARHMNQSTNIVPSHFESLIAVLLKMMYHRHVSWKLRGVSTDFEVLERETNPEDLHSRLWIRNTWFLDRIRIF